MSSTSTDSSAVKPETRNRLEQALLELAADPKARLYAAIDGASAPGLTGRLESVEIAHHSLYPGADADLMAGGPWFVDPYHFHLGDDDLYEQVGKDSVIRKAKIAARPADPVAQVGALLAALPDSRAAVFWIGDASLTQEKIYQHLRGLNRITLAAEPGSPFKTETVTFRHADANVMAQVLPAFDNLHYARFLGPAQAVMFTPHEEWGGDCIRANKLEKPITVPAGFLHWDRATLKAIGERRFTLSRNRIIAYLHEVAPDVTQTMDKAELDEFAKTAMDTGQALGIQSVAAHCRWAYLMMLTKGALATSPDIRNFMTAEMNISADERVQLLMEQTCLRLKPPAAA